MSLAIGLGACLNAGLLYYKLRSHEIFQPQPGWAIFMAKIAVALAAMGTVLWFGSGSEASWLVGPALDRALRLGSVVAIGITSYFATLWLLGFRLKDFARRGTV